MIRKLTLALAAVAAIGAAGLASSTDAQAKKWHGGGWGKGGIHIGIGHGFGWRHRYWGPSYGLYGHGGCFHVVGKYGVLRLVCRY